MHKLTAHAGLVLIKTRWRQRQEKLPYSQKLDASAVVQQFCQDMQKFFSFFNLMLLPNQSIY